MHINKYIEQAVEQSRTIRDQYKYEFEALNVACKQVATLIPRVEPTSKSKKSRKQGRSKGETLVLRGFGMVGKGITTLCTDEGMTEAECKELLERLYDDLQYRLYCMSMPVGWCQNLVTIVYTVVMVTYF